MVAFTSCHLDDLCYDHPHYPKLLIEVDLSEAGGATFEDLQSYNIIFYPIDDGFMELSALTPTTKRVQTTGEISVSLAPGLYRAVMYSDYSGQNYFYETDDYDAIYCEAFSYEFYNMNPTYTYTKGVDMGYTYTPEPELLVTDVIEEFEILESDDPSLEYSGQSITFTPTKATQEINITIKVENITSIASYVGEIGKVDSRFYITQERYNHSDHAIQLTDNNTTFEYYNSGSSDGEINICITSFGFTQTESSDVEGMYNSDYAYLYLELELVDGSSYLYGPIDLTSDVNGYYFGEDIVLSLTDLDREIVLPYFEPISDGGGAGVSVGDWGSEQIVEIPF